MRIVFITQWFPPEHAPIGYMILELSQALVLEGHDVTIITSFPNHPTGKVYPGYKVSGYQKSNEFGVNILRVYQFISENRSLLFRAFGYLSFTLSACVALLRLRKFNVIFSLTQPLFLGFFLPFISKYKGSTLIFNVQDLHPDALVKLGLLKNPFLISILRSVERMIIHKSDRLAVISNGFRDHCVNLGASIDKIQVIPNWINDDSINPTDRVNPFREKLEIAESTFVILYAGTLGHVADYMCLLNAAKFIDSYELDIKFVVVGEGTSVDKMKRDINSMRLSSFIHVPFQPRHMLSYVQGISDVSIVTISPGAGINSVPSKVLGYMAAARPIIAAADENTETARVISNAKCGLVCSPGNPEALGYAILQLFNDRNLRDVYALNGFNYMKANFSKSRIIEKYIKFIIST